jgi:hypothetical protein
VENMPPKPDPTKIVEAELTNTESREEDVHSNLDSLLKVGYNGIAGYYKTLEKQKERDLAVAIENELAKDEQQKIISDDFII